MHRMDVRSFQMGRLKDEFEKAGADVFIPDLLDIVDFQVLDLKRLVNAHTDIGDDIEERQGEGYYEY